MDKAEKQEDKTVRITHVTLNLTPEIGEDDCLVYTRVVPDGREGTVVYARSLLPGEQDDGRAILLEPESGERLVFRPGAIRLSIDDADRLAKTEPDGYRPITNTVWTWLRFGPILDVRLFRHLLASARRLDGTYVLFAEIVRTMNDMSGTYIARRARLFRALATAEIFVVALGRTMDLLDGFRENFSAPIPVPTILDSKKQSVRELRNAFEHIDDRALGQVRGRASPEALSIFDQRSFIQEGKLTYAGYSLDVREGVIHMLTEARQYILDVTVHFAGGVKEFNSPIRFFEASTNETNRERGSAPDA
jgi:hypothetical protein